MAALRAAALPVRGSAVGQAVRPALARGHAHRLDALAPVLDEDAARGRVRLVAGGGGRGQRRGRERASATSPAPAGTPGEGHCGVRFCDAAEVVLVDVVTPVVETPFTEIEIIAYLKELMSILLSFQCTVEEYSADVETYEIR